MSVPTLLKFICKDSMCRTIIPIGQSETNVECIECGIKYDEKALKDAEPITEFDDLKMTCLRRGIAYLLPKRGAESVKVNGLSNFYCKLLSPLLTHYGLDPVTGRVKLLTEMHMSDILDCSIFKDRAFLIDPDQLSIVGFGRDVSGSINYLSETLKIIEESNDGEERLVPIYTDGDGHCLVHAISRALVGRELFWHPLRCCLKRHFEMNLIKYRELFKDFMEPEDWKAIIEESDPDFKPPEGELHGLRNVHIFGLANILKRPIILLDSLQCMRKSGDYSALFVPGFVPPEDCRGKDHSLNKPICIAWSSFSHNHYIPLVGVQNRPLPVLPHSLIPKVWGMPQSEFGKYIDLDSSGNCVIGGGRVLTENYIQRLVKGMEALFLEKKGVHPMLVADAKFYICSEPAYINMKVEILIENTRVAAEIGFLYRCLYCKSLCKFNLKSSLLSPGGLVYNILFSRYHQFNAGTSYKVPDSGLSCKYDPVKNEFVLDMSATDLPTCTVCGSSLVRRVRPDGTTVDLPGDENSTSVGAISSIPKNISSMNKTQESNSTSSQESMQNKVIKSETVSGQESKSPVNESENELANKKQSDMLSLNIKWNGKALQHSISLAKFKELGSSPQEWVSNFAFSIAAKFFPNESQDINFHLYVSDEIWNQISKISVDNLNSPVTYPVEDKSENESMIVESPAECGGDAALSEPQYIKVVTSSGQQENLALGAGISYSQLQEWIAAKFKIPKRNQKIKSGYLPKELEVPTDVNKRNLPLKHGDRLLVESSNLSASQTKNQLNTTSHNSDIDAQNCVDIPENKVSPEVLWTVVKRDPDLFKKGGTFFESAANTHILCDKDHISLPCFPTKRFCYNALTYSLELCVKSYGHFQISGDIDERIERVKRGEHVTGFKRCPQMGPPKEAIVSRPFRKPITPSSEDGLPLYRKGPGFSVLSKSSENMDFS